MSGKNTRNFVIFGGTGDLSYRKLMPALFNLYKRGKLGQGDRILAIGRREYSTAAYTDIITEWIKQFARYEKSEQDLQEFFKHIHYVKMDFTKVDAYKNLEALLTQKASDTHIFYFAVAPKFFEDISQGLETLSSLKHKRIVLEKPFGETLERAEKLSIHLEETFGRENIYRIDHYLGKEMVRSITTIRATNPLFRYGWNKDNIEKVSIAALEEVGVGSRGGYYDEAGAMKDMVQNHLMQILTLVAMELPQSMDDMQSLQSNQEAVLTHLRPLELVNIQEDVILAQYSGYTDEENIASNSRTETYAQCRIFIDNERWENVPFILTTGKKLAARSMEVCIAFKAVGGAPANSLTLEVQPREGVKFSFNIKKPGEENTIIPVQMDFCQSCNANLTRNSPEAYERLLDAVLQEDGTWFSTWKQIAASWRYIEGLKQEHQRAGLPLLLYEAASHGPKPL